MGYQAAVCWRNSPTQTQTASPISEQPIAVATPQRNWNLRYRWDLGSLQSSP